MTTATKTQYIHCTGDRNCMSLGIFDLIDGKAERVECTGTYSHPDHAGQTDWNITLYKITVDGTTIHAAATNGNPVWEEEDSETWANLMEEYGVNGELQ